ncbi:MAG: cytoplasmic protein [Deltaproteobacteria bacterium]|nr:cytoplasmic protein [Deltaproteobacteria bacterium]
MPKHTHNFVEEYNGLVGFGLNRETDEKTVIYYLQKFSDDKMMNKIIGRLTDKELEEIFLFINTILKKHLIEEEYHKLFLKD